MLPASLMLAFTPHAGRAADPFDPGPHPLLMRHPTLSATSIVFAYAGDLWTVPRAGGEAHRLTSAPGIESDPYFSPDGSTIAFTGMYDGNVDVFTVPATGGVPKRLTYNPAPQEARGWTPDGKSVLFSSPEQSPTDYPRLFTVSANGGVPRPLPFPAGNEAAFSPDGSQLAYVPNDKWELAWKRYRGGQATPIWLAQMSDSKVKPVPRKDENLSCPMWIGNAIFYLSDANGVVGMMRYGVKDGKATEVIKGEGFDLKSACAGPGAIVVEKLGSIWLYDLDKKTVNRVPITVAGDFPEVRPAFKDLRPNLEDLAISPSGQRLVVAARGFVATVPASKGDVHFLDEKQGLHRRSPRWSPDAKTIAYVTDAAGHDELALFDTVAGTEKRLALPEALANYSLGEFSPDSKRIAFTDNHNNLWTIELATGKCTKVDHALYTDPQLAMAPRWSPDSKWVAYARDLPSHLEAIFLYNTETGKSTQITDGLANAKSPIFDRDGKNLYFFASTNSGQSTSWLDLSSYNAPNSTSTVYAVVLRKDLPNPLQPQSDEESPAPAKPTGPTPPSAFSIDLDGIESRTIALPMPTQDYAALEPGPAGSFFAVALGPKATATAPPSGVNLWKFSMAERTASPFAPGVAGANLTADGTKVMLAQAGSIRIVPAAAPMAVPGAPVDLSGLRVKVDPHQEWVHMFHEIWHNERTLFYDPGLHGIDGEAMDRRYAPFLDGIASRDDLNYLFTDMLGEISVGHMWAQGGDIPGVRGVPGGLLGADYSFENGHYRLVRVYDGERWNPGLYAPLAQPGVNAKAGEYILAIDGKPLLDSNDIYEALEGKAGRQVKIKIGPSTDEKQAREVVVVPVASEFALRQRAWEEDNRRLVEKLTNGRGGYVHVPDTNSGGWDAFTRYYYAQVGKDGLVVDERFNHGGLINDFMVREMKKTPDAAFVGRDGLAWPTPGAAIYGPKVMLANEMSGSGGDMFPWLFKHEEVGPVIGKRTWGGLIAAFSFGLVDGGRINSPNDAFFNLNGTWDVEGHGVDPDIEVDLDPYLWRQGKDAQLMRAIDELNKRLAAYTPVKLAHPPYPDKSKPGHARQ